MSRKSTSLRRNLMLSLIIAMVSGVVTSGLVNRWSMASQLQQRAISQTILPVRTIAPIPIDANYLELPARIEAWATAPLYARVSGYLKSWSVEIGSTVKENQVLAEIETPDLDQQLTEAQARLVRARSELTLAATTAKRWQQLRQGGSVSRQEVEERVADLAAKQAEVNALQANVQRINVLQDYKKITAPFDGTVTARNTDVGQLINVGMNEGSELFTVSDISQLRVYVNVPQRQIASIKIGNAAQLSVPERPNKTYKAVVRSMSQAINASSGTMLVQLSVDNKSEELLAGSFATIRFELPTTTSTLGIPPSALVIDRNGTQIATVDRQNKVILKPVTINRDFGNVIELSKGIYLTDQIINNPPDGIATGDHIRIVNTAGKSNIEL